MEKIIPFLLRSSFYKRLRSPNLTVVSTSCVAGGKPLSIQVVLDHPSELERSTRLNKSSPRNQSFVAFTWLLNELQATATG